MNMNELIKIKEYIGKKINLFNVKNFDSLYNSGVDAFGKQDYEKAIKYFKLSLEQDKIKPQVYYNLALTYQSIKDYDRAIVTYNKFIELNPKDYDGLYNLALVYYTKENFLKAIEFFEKCVEAKEEKTEDSVKALVLAYLSNNEIQKAIDFSKNILETSKNGLDLYYKIAKLFEHKNSLNKDFTHINLAIEMYSKITEKDPEHFDAYLSISICYAKKGEWEESVKFCEKALEANPKSYEANNQMGLVYYCCNEVKKAVNYYEIALKLKPKGDFKVYSNLGYAYEKIGQYDKAINIFSQLIRKFPQCLAKDEIKNHLRILKTL